MKDIIVTLEALLIEGLEPRQNRKRGDAFKAVEYFQAQDPEIARKNKKKVLEEAMASLEDAAARADFEVERMRQWEHGEERPSIPQLRKLGEVYRRPIAVFFLPLHQCTVAVGPQEDEEVVSQRVRELLGVSWETQLAWNSPYMVLLRNAGHRTSPMEGQRLPEDQLLERVSNRFAAAILMPRRAFLAEAANHPAALAGDDEGLRRFASRIKVSPEAILRRLLSLRRMGASLYRQKRRSWRQRSWYATPQSAGGPPIEVKIVSSVGRPFAALVLEGYQRNAVGSADVVDYLGIQLKYLDRIARQLVSGPGDVAAS